jgi:hypothetical protein
VILEGSGKTYGALSFWFMCLADLLVSLYRTTKKGGGKSEGNLKKRNKN